MPWHCATAGVGSSALVRGNGELVVVGNFTGSGGATIPEIALRNGVAWTSTAARADRLHETARRR